MASPFPGMDPYLENTDFWKGFHNGFIHYVQEDAPEEIVEAIRSWQDERQRSA